MEEEKTQKVITVSKKKLTIFTIVVVLILLLVWGTIWVFQNAFGVNLGQTQSMSSKYDGVGNIPMVPDYRRETSDITDKREFFKTSYSAQIETRTVSDVVDRVETVVHKVEGRVDNISSSEKYGRVSFVIPKNKLFEFRDEIENITNKKLFTEETSSQNLLNQKQNIESRTENTNKTLAQLQEEKSGLDSAHTGRIRSIQNQITDLENQVKDIQVLISGLEQDDEYGLSALNNQYIALQQRIAALKQDQTNENRNYVNQNNILVTQINRVGGDLELLAEEDVAFENNIETVNGYVSVKWISYWNIGNRFSPTPMWVNTVILVFIILWVLKRKKILPKVQVV